MACRVGDVVALLEELAPPDLAEEWDNVGLQVGSAQAGVTAVLISLDATPEVIAEAREAGAGMLVCHHPPIFRPLRRLLTEEPPGSLLRDALAAGVTIYAAHTNLDASPCGVNAALAEVLGLVDHRPLQRSPDREGRKLVTFLPPQHVAAVSEALFRAGAGTIGDYAGCSFRVEGTGTFTPGPHSHPAYGEATGPNEVREVRLEVVVPGDRLDDAVEALLAAHPYEEPAYDVYALRNPASAGLGRVGDLPGPVSLRDLARRCRDGLGAPVVRLAGDPSRMVRRAAVCGGSGAGLAARARSAGAQVLITGDVSHHEAGAALDAGLAVIDAGHYHTERPVVPHLASLLAEKAVGAGLEVEVHASTVDTCPWSSGGGG